MDAYIGSILLWTLDYAPQDWAFCDGRVLQASEYQALFALLGNRYGGDGRTTFTLPDLRSLVPVGVDNRNPNYALAKKGGSLNAQGFSVTSTFTIGVTNLPAHTHSAAPAGSTISIAIPANNSNGNTSTPGTNTVLATGNSGSPLATIQTRNYSTAAGNTTLLPFTATLPATNTTGSTGGSQPISVNAGGSVTPTMPPYIAMNYIICVYGIYPSRP